MSDIADLLNNESGFYETALKIDRFYGDQPDVLEAIKSAKRRGVSAASIARLLSTDEVSFSENAVRTWLERNY